MTSRDKLQWSRAFIDQAKLDSDLAQLLYQIIKSDNEPLRLGSRPDLYRPAIYAYCQQAIEKALKGLLWYERGTIPRKHNPLNTVLKLNQTKERNRPKHLDIICRNHLSINQILNMAPGAASENARMDVLLRQANTEYPFCSSDGSVRLPCQEISSSDLAAALKITGPIVLHIRKYLEVAGLAPSNVFTP